MSIPDDFAPKPTLPTGGLDRMLRIWEALRDSNQYTASSANALRDRPCRANTLHPVIAMTISRLLRSAWERILHMKGHGPLPIS
jgi:hypothetical protein